VDAHGIATMLGLSHPNSVSTYLRRYPEMPRPVIDLGPGRPKLWLHPEIDAWAKEHARRSRGRPSKKSGGESDR